ncbi:MAG: 30S ribosomal protein S20 [Bacteroidia bacterium]
MAHHKSALKRIRKSAVRRLRNRYKHVSMRSAIKKLRHTTNKTAAQEMLPKVVSMIDKVAKHNIIHKNKAANLKSGLTVLVNKLG